MLRTHFDLRWLTLAVFCTLSVLTLTHLPQDPTPESLRSGFFHIDKAEHVLAYGVIALFFILALRKPTQLRMLLSVLLGLGAVGMADELTQPCEGRSESVAPGGPKL